MNFKELLTKYSYPSIEQRLTFLYPEEKILTQQGKYQKLYSYLISATPLIHNVGITIKTNIDNTEKSRQRYWAVGQILNSNIQRKQINRANLDLEMEFALLEDWLGCQCILDNYSDKDFISHVLYEISYLGFEYKIINPNLDFVKNEVIVYSEGDKDNNYIKIELHDIEKELQFADGN
jgi:hypothetical protein